MRGKSSQDEQNEKDVVRRRMQRLDTRHACTVRGRSLKLFERSTRRRFERTWVVQSVLFTREPGKIITTMDGTYIKRGRLRAAQREVYNRKRTWKGCLYTQIVAAYDNEHDPVNWQSDAQRKQLT